MLLRPLFSVYASAFLPKIAALLGVQGTGKIPAPYDHVHPFGGAAVDGLTAHAGGGQGSALVMTGVVNRFSVVATAADSGRLPAMTAGMIVMVINDGANSMQVFGAGTDTINNVATAIGVALAAGKTGWYACPVAGKVYGGALA